MKQYRRFFLYCGIIMLASEIWKQWTLTFYINNGQYIWWYFPFQLCSIPMYICLMLGFIHSEKIQRILLAFLMDFGLLAGIFTFFDTSGMQYTYLPLTIHSYTWHILLIIIGIRAGVAYQRLYDHSSGKTNKSQKHFAHHKPDSDYQKSCGIYLGCVLLATIFNLLFSPLGTINMFYINPYLPMRQKVFGTIAAVLGNGTGITAYIGATIIGALLFHHIWNTVFRHFQNHPFLKQRNISFKK